MEASGREHLFPTLVHAWAKAIAASSGIGSRNNGWGANGAVRMPAPTTEGARVCLYTDQANQTSNKIYASLGYRPVADMANLVIVR